MSARKLRYNAERLGMGSMMVDYRAMGYVTEVKDQVRTFNFLYHLHLMKLIWHCSWCTLFPYMSRDVL